MKVAIDARLIKSASAPISNGKIKKLKDAQSTSEANLDKNGNVKKFSRDLMKIDEVNLARQKLFSRLKSIVS